MSDPWEWWTNAIAGNVGPIHDEPVCGYFKVRDRRGENKNLAPVKRPWVPVAIWIENGEFVAELGGYDVPVDTVWPYCAKNPVPHTAYHYWHIHDAWPTADDLKDYAA